MIEYQKVIDFLGNRPNQPSKFRTKNSIEEIDDFRRMYNTNSQIKFKTSVLRLILCDCSDKYILVRGTVAVVALAAGAGNRNIQAVFKNCSPFTNCISKINNTQIDNARDIDLVMAMYNLIEYGANHSKTSGSLWNYYRDQTGLKDAGAINDIRGNSTSFKFKQKITGSIGNDST